MHKKDVDQVIQFWYWVVCILSRNFC